MSLTTLLPVPPKSTFNVGLVSPKNAFMLGLFGHPVAGGNYRADGKCTPPNAPNFVALVRTRNVGPFKATGIVPALDSLAEILARVNVEEPALFAKLSTAGMLCARFTKIMKAGKLKIGPGISNHSFGTAIDIKIDGKLDAQGDGTVQRGLLILSAFFNAAGWYWGAAFPTEDAMHFEASKSLLAKWKKDGKI